MHCIWWNRNLVEEVFLAEEAEKIYGIAISPLKQADKLVWVGNKNGEFSIKSAYHLTRSSLEMEGGSGSNPPGDGIIWKAVWKLRATRIVCMFIWKACNNILPTKENLFKRGITKDAVCPICRTTTKTVGHALWTCPAAKDVWIEHVKGIRKSPSEEDGFINIFEMLRGRLSEDDLQRVVFAVCGFV
jgi:hypothetical protein